MPPAFIRTYPPAEPAAGPAHWLAFRAAELLVQIEPAGATLPFGDASILHDLEPGEPLYLGILAGAPVLACEVPDHAPVPDGWRAVNLRGLYGLLPEPAYGLAGYATEMLAWCSGNGFCHRCGAPTEAMVGDWGRRCTRCAHTSYPPVSPAIIVLVHDGDQVLLTHKAGWGPRFSIIAGFVEPGESLEECVTREIFEEVGVEVDEITYVGSQPWPFPHQVMIGYMARYTSGEIVIDAHELDEARWFHVDALPDLPPPLSISRQIIDRWLHSRRPG
jgi:NAD+ diphosphatase